MEEKLVFPDVVEKSVLWGTMPKAKMADRYKAIVDARTGTLFAIVLTLVHHSQGGVPEPPGEP